MTPIHNRNKQAVVRLNDVRTGVINKESAYPAVSLEVTD